MKNDALVSVIVPVYNVEKYLYECIDSIIAQTYKNIEILLIDDGSTDSSGVICDEYANANEFICAYHKKNGGLSSARNFGIEKSRGKYILFVDSDDYILPNMIEKLQGMCERNKTKISACNYFNVYDGEIEFVRETKREYLFTSKEMFKKILTENGRIEMCAVNKLYHTSIFDMEGNRFPDGRLFEDLGSMYKYMFSVDKVSYIDEGLYCYRRVREGSITFTWNGKREFDRISMSENMVNFIKLNAPSLYNDAVGFKFMNTYLTSINLMVETDHYDKDIYFLAQKDIANNRESLKLSGLPIVKKIQILVAAKNYQLYRLVYKFLKK